MKFSAVKGMQDLLPPETSHWHRVESAARRVFAVYGFQEIRLPILEMTEVFTRSIGESTDIVTKEMYTFTDKGGRSVTMRPEGTAPAVRCYVEHNLSALPAPQKFFYMGPMFRYERPQKGRLRQFFQIGAEAFGTPHPTLDAEIVAMLQALLAEVGLEGIVFELNSIGCETCRPAYREAIRGFFEAKRAGLCPDCQRRLDVNPLRILDCKVERCGELRQGTPVVSDFLCAICRDHFTALQSHLADLDISYTLNPHLVRGLDYYTRTTFEVTSERLGAQKAVAAGGRYDRLVEEFGGPPTPAVGFAVGMERLVALLMEHDNPPIGGPRAFIATLGKDAEREGLRMAEAFRRRGHWVEINYGGASLRSQLRKADRIGAEYAFILGDDELRSGRLKWKNLIDGTDGDVAIEKCMTLIATRHHET